MLRAVDLAVVRPLAELHDCRIDVDEDVACPVAAELARQFPAGVFFWWKSLDGEPGIVTIVGDLPCEQWVDVIDGAGSVGLAVAVLRECGEPVVIPHASTH